MPICGIVGCSNRPGEDRSLSFFKIPKVINGQGDETRMLSEERRRMWKAAVNRADIQNEDKWDRTLVCSKHFVGGVKAYLHDKPNPSWSPTLFLRPKSDTPHVKDTASSRYKRASERKDKRERADAISSLLALKRRRIEFTNTESEIMVNNDENLINETNTDLETSDTAEENEANEISNHVETDTQTDLTCDMIYKLENDLKLHRIECDKKPVMDLYNLSFYEQNVDAVSFYTGLPNYGVLRHVFKFIKDFLPENSKALSKEQQYLICLVKLRMNYLLKDMAYQLQVSSSTVQRAFHKTLDVIHTRLQFLVKWPDRENLKKTMPMSFRKDFGTKVVVVIDCFELFTERPSGAENKVSTYSNYKHHQTIKYLIGVAPQGAVTFISEGWGGRTSDKYITEKSNMLDNLLPGDIVMADRGFCIEESVQFYGAELVIPSFTKGKPQLHPLDVEKTRKIASVRIHVERVIGLVLRKFRIFEGIIPLEFIRLRTGETIPTIDKIVRVACCLTNLCLSVVPLD